ncbi:MAG: beta-Ala-His dipeptidase, partial [Bacteroidota bacterium]
MSNVLSNLNPGSLWQIFEEICNVPHPSKHEKMLADYVLAFAAKHGIESQVDTVGNVILRKPATAGKENLKGIILQAHLDMVPQKNSDTNHDFEKDSIKPQIDGEWVKATGTTLGADNAIGMAAAMAVMADKTIEHGPLECLFTVDEETGMTGAFGLKAGLFKGDILMNLDSEDEGELYVGCAGGTNANLKFRYTEEAVPADSIALSLVVKGLKGGHSGVDIALERGNANKIMNRLLWFGIKNCNLRLASINGGSLRNAIPRESFAVVTLPKQHEAAFVAFAKELAAIVIAEYKGVETDIAIEATSTAAPAFVIDAKTTTALINAVYATPNGVMRMSQDMQGLVETSTNLAIVKSYEKQIDVMCLLRSSVDSAKDDLEKMISSVYELAGAEVVLDGKYPGWKPNMDSP